MKLIKGKLSSHVDVQTVLTNCPSLDSTICLLIVITIQRKLHRGFCRLIFQKVFITEPISLEFHRMNQLQYIVFLTDDDLIVRLMCISRMATLYHWVWTVD